MSRREREEAYRRAQGRYADPCGTSGQRSGWNPGNVYAAYDVDRRERYQQERRRDRRHSNADDLAYSFAGLNMGDSRSSRNRAGRNVHWEDEHMPEPSRRSRSYRTDRWSDMYAPEPSHRSRSHRWADEYALEPTRRSRSHRADRWADGYVPETSRQSHGHRNDEYYGGRAQRSASTYQDNYGQQPRRQTFSSTPHLTSLRFGWLRHHDPNDSFRDRVRRWF
ncbi:hypothetical protein C7974DRAFT_425185 [Boeremia exigua]|uniref:uncharacterized protein n=1 Tax=Boeremia exigua TaxID=749465 RepID=UPI001E8E735A|nr:uncharacterized protein C7974DRAFT_425185 [Boeremia exigua]KAH6625543.1 hypothetical protein C7974DRAFT_425185 [Boeremia exigua]